MRIEKLTNQELLGYYYDAVCDNNYNPSKRAYNTSGFDLWELESEILKRMEVC